MKYPSEQFDQAVADICHGTINQNDLEAFTELIANDREARKEYLWRLEVHGYLGSHYKRLVAASEPEEDQPLAASDIAESGLRINDGSRPASRRKSLSFGQFLSAAAITLAAFVGVWWSQPESSSPEPVKITLGEIAALEDTLWIQPESHRKVGDKIGIDDRIELTAGTAKVRFTSGAELKLVGPSILQPLSGNSAFLTLGHADIVADSPESKGFTLITPTSRYVDIGTRFSVWATPDGFNRLEVTDGEVNVFSKEWTEPKRMSASQSLLIEPGSKKILTTIEAGDGTAAFQFPTIAPPSKDDIANLSKGPTTVRVWMGTQSRDYPISLLIDGEGNASNPERKDQSFFFGMNSEGQVLLDLGRKVPIEKINTYSWFRTSRNLHGQRAKQVYTLYGYLGGPDLDAAPTFTPELPLEETGWVRIARVNSQETFKKLRRRPRQQASSITSTDGEIGRYRYLIWHIEGRTPYKEFDVYLSNEEA